MTTITAQLAEALRALLATTGQRPVMVAQIRDAEPEAIKALAAYDAQQAQPAPAGDHTPEPWQVDAFAWRVIVPRSRPEHCDEVIFDIAEGQDNTDNAAHLANARRIVACVNACAGIRTDALENIWQMTVKYEDGDVFRTVRT